ncbi:MAG: disulfide bond formation protein B [bacterium]|nr:disulfide bond formation protein B [bacterium]
MPSIISYVTQAYSLLTIAGQILIAAALIALIFFYGRLKANKTFSWFLKNSLWLALLVAILAVSGSLFYSEIAGFEPCKLCWLQRIFMYPQVILISLALALKDRNIIFYSSALAIPGAIIAAYNYLMQINAVPVTSCSAVGYSVSCSKVFVLNYGYITISMMALTAFIMILLLMLMQKIYWDSKNIS